MHEKAQEAHRGRRGLHRGCTVLICMVQYRVEGGSSPVMTRGRELGEGWETCATRERVRLKPDTGKRRAQTQGHCGQHGSNTAWQGRLRSSDLLGRQVDSKVAT